MILHKAFFRDALYGSSCRQAGTILYGFQCLCFSIKDITKIMMGSDKSLKIFVWEKDQVLISYKQHPIH